MKTASALFRDRLLIKSGGENPILLFKIYYGGGSYHTVAMDRVQIGTTLYSPWVKECGPIEFGTDDEYASLLPPNEMSITLLRNTVTDTLFSHSQKYKKVEVWRWFRSLTNWSDALEIGTFIVDQVVDITQGTFTLRCLSDESKFDMEVPTQLLSLSWYPYMVEDYDDEQPWPLVLGHMENPVGNDKRYLDGYLNNAVPAFCTHKNTYNFMFYGHSSVLCPSPAQRAYKYEGNPKMHANLFSLILGSNVFSTASSGSRYWVDLNDFDETNYGNHRMLRLLPARPGASNNVTDWQKACDKDRSTVANLSVSENDLFLDFDLIEGIGNFIPSGWADTSYVRVKTALNIDAISGTVAVYLYHPLGSTVMGTYNSTGYKESAATWSNPGGGPLELNRFSIRVVLTAGTSAQIDGAHLMMGYFDRMDVVAPVSKHRKAPRRRGLATWRKEVDRPEWKGGQIYMEARGPTDQSGQGWNYFSPFSMLYFLLVKEVGLLSSEIDINQWNSINTAMGSSWNFGRSLVQRTPLRDVLDSLLRESGLKMWRDAFNKLRLYRMNVAAGSPHMTFTDEEGSIYLMKDFKWGWSEEFFNRFDMKFKWDYGGNEFQVNYLKDRSNDTDLALSYALYSNAEVDYIFPECDWIRDSAVLDLLFPILKKYWGELKVWIEFRSSLAGCLLELGDTIRTNHRAQDWVGSAKDFQVVRIIDHDNEVQIKAVEVIT